jgi:hypothetical protein
MVENARKKSSGAHYAAGITRILRLKCVFKDVPEAENRAKGCAESGLLLDCAFGRQKFSAWMGDFDPKSGESRSSARIMCNATVSDAW